MKELILIVEDEKDIARLLEYNLKKEGYAVRSVHDGRKAVAAAKSEKPGLIILDLMLPGMDGLEVCKELKREPCTASVPVIMLTAKSGESDKVVGLELGADDYITKPFSPRELMARVKAVLRRVQAKEAPRKVIRVGSLVIDLSRIRVTLKDKAVELTAKEFELLKELVKSGGRVLSRNHLLDVVWGLDESLDIQTRTVDAHIRALRKKLKDEADRILTVKNYGYMFEDEE